MVAFLYRMPSGIRGDISRKALSKVDSLPLNSSLTFSTFGVFGKVVSGKFVPLVANDLASNIVGLFARPYPITGSSGSDPLGTATPQTTGIADVLVSGYMTVVCNAGTPAVGGTVYARVANAGGSTPLNGIEATSEIAATSTAGTNTGNGTMSAVSSTYAGLDGSFNVVMLTATTFRVNDPTGARLVDGATAVAYSKGGIAFTLTAGGTAFVAGDSFTIAVVHNTIPVNAKFTSTMDSSKNVEIQYNI